MLDEHWRKALLVLDLHRVEHAAVGIEADKELAACLEILKCLHGLSVKNGDVKCPSRKIRPRTPGPGGGRTVFGLATLRRGIAGSPPPFLRPRWIRER